MKLKIADYNIWVDDESTMLREWFSETKYSQIIILVDENTLRDCFSIFLEKSAIRHYQVITIQSGEINKNIDTCQQIWKKMLDFQINRKALMVNLGGGVIGDMGGFCAATYMRGIDFIQVPTTLLSQVDSSIGGKLGIDFGTVKNSVGVFRNPKAVFIDTTYFKTLPFREIRSGYAEIIKHALIADNKLWQKLSIDLSSIDWKKLIIPSLRIKQRIVTTDPYEKNIRKALNFGHTVGHALESFSLSSQQPLLHGEAIAAGMLIEAYLSKMMNGLSDNDFKMITHFVQAIYPKYVFDKKNYQQLIALMQLDKKNEQGTINCSLLSAIGQVSVNQNIREYLMLEALEWYNIL